MARRKAQLINKINELDAAVAERHVAAQGGKLDALKDMRADMMKRRASSLGSFTGMAPGMTGGPDHPASPGWAKSRKRAGSDVEAVKALAAEAASEAAQQRRGLESLREELQGQASQVGGGGMRFLVSPPLVYFIRCRPRSPLSGPFAGVAQVREVWEGLEELRKATAMVLSAQVT